MTMTHPTSPASRTTLTAPDGLTILTELATAALARYGLGGLRCVRLMNLSENAMFRVETEDGPGYVLRVHRAGYHSRTAIESELAWMTDLRRTDVAVTPVPVPGRDGALLQEASHPLLDQPRHVVLFHWEDGVEPGIGEDLSRPIEILGETAARMHLHARKWQRPPFFNRHRWDLETALGERNPHWGRWRDGIGMTPEKERLIGRTVDLIGRRLRSYGEGAERFGLIHGDLRLANILVNGGNVKVIDFDDCGESWYMYDAATVVSFHEHQPQAPELIERWKAGYRKVLPITPAEEAEIPTFIMFRRILLVAWVASHIEAEFPRSLGAGFTEATLPLCETYLSRFS